MQRTRRTGRRSRLRRSRSSDPRREEAAVRERPRPGAGPFSVSHVRRLLLAAARRAAPARRAGRSARRAAGSRACPRRGLATRGGALLARARALLARAGRACPRRGLAARSGALLARARALLARAGRLAARSGALLAAR